MFISSLNVLRLFLAIVYESDRNYDSIELFCFLIFESQYLSLKLSWISWIRLNFMFIKVGFSARKIMKQIVKLYWIFFFYCFIFNRKY